MKIYVYDKDTGEFLFSSDAQVNPIKIGEYIYPPNSTRITPPEFKEGEIAIFNGKYWKILPDYRGHEQIDLETLDVSQIKEFGPLKEGYMLYSEFVLSDMYKEIAIKQQISDKKDEILAEMEEVDLKRIRAFCEPSVKDEVTGETWLDFYNMKMSELRQRLLEV